MHYCKPCAKKKGWPAPDNGFVELMTCDECDGSADCRYAPSSILRAAERMKERNETTLLRSTDQES